MRSAVLFLSVIAFCALAVVSGQSLAQQSSGSVLMVSPHRLIVTADEKSESISLSNQSDRLRRYDLSLVDQVMTEEGVTLRKDGFEYSVRPFVKFMPKRITIKPGERQLVRVQVNRPKDLADGDYHSHLLFREIPPTVKDKQQLKDEREEAQKNVSFEIRTLYGIAVPIIVQQGKVDGAIAMGAPALGKTADGKQRTVDIEFTRTGNSEAAGKVTILYAAPGKDPVSVTDAQWVRLYREVSKVKKQFVLNSLPEGAAGGKLLISMMRDEDDESKTDKVELDFN